MYSHLSLSSNKTIGLLIYEGIYIPNVYSPSVYFICCHPSNCSVSLQHINPPHRVKTQHFR